jgi:predicted dehydrogenase
MSSPPVASVVPQSRRQVKHARAPKVPLRGGEEALIAQRILDGVYESSKTGKEVKV